jgi:hypothetical protein
VGILLRRHCLAARRGGGRRGDAITAREADDLLRDAEAFHHLVEASFGLPYQQVLPGALPTCN